LLIPWASSVLAERPEPGEGPVALMDIYRGRSFRFCLNNQFQADLIARYLAGLEGNGRLHKAVVVEDRYDQYSVDFGACFRRAIGHVVPSAEIIDRSDTVGLPVLYDPAALPTPAEEALAESIWRDAESLPQGEATWVILPLQKEPTRRLLEALSRSPHARREPHPGDTPLRVVCGDTIGVGTLSQLAGRCP